MTPFQCNPPSAAEPGRRVIGNSADPGPVWLALHPIEQKGQSHEGIGRPNHHIRLWGQLLAQRAKFDFGRFDSLPLSQVQGRLCYSLLEDCFCTVSGCFEGRPSTLGHLREMPTPMLAVNWAIRPVQCLYLQHGARFVLGARLLQTVTDLRGSLGSMDRGEKRTSGFKSKHGLHSLKWRG